MNQQVPTWLAVVIIVIVLVIVGVGYWVVSSRQKVVTPPETFQPGKTAPFVPKGQGGQQQTPAPQGQ